MLNPSVSTETQTVPQLTKTETVRLHRGEVLVKTRTHTACGGALDARMYLPVGRSQIWENVTEYSRWTQFFPDVTQSRIIDQQKPELGKRLYQAAEKSFLFISAQVDLYLHVFEIEQQHIRFQLDKGSFSDFTADIMLSDLDEGTLLQYSVSATPLIPVPSFFIEQAMKMDLPNNMRNMRRQICRR